MTTLRFSLSKFSLSKFVLTLLAFCLLLTGAQVRAGQVAQSVLTRTATGLLARSTFQSDPKWSTQNGPTGSQSAYWAQESAPTLVSFGYSPILAQSPTATAATLDAGGCRESQLFVDSDGTWYLWYGAGDGTTGTSGQWRPQAAVSTDRGLTWVKKGSWGRSGAADDTGIQKDNVLADGSWSARDFDYLEKRGGTYYLYPLVAQSNITGGTSPVPGAPYTTDCWTATSALGPWTFLQSPTSLGASGTFTDSCNYLTSFVRDTNGAGYYFMNTNANVGFNNVGMGYQGGLPTSGNIPGAYEYPMFIYGYSLIGSAFTDNRGETVGYFENPKVFWSAALSRYVMLTNYGPVALPSTDRNLITTSVKLTDWSASTGTTIASQHLSAMDGNASIGIASPVYAPEDKVIMDASGFVPITYDGFEPSTTGNQVHIGRKIAYSVLEPSPACLHYMPGQGTITTSFFADAFSGSGTLAGYNGWSQPTGGTGSFAASPAITYNAGQMVLPTASAATAVIAINTAAGVVLNPTIDADVTLQSGTGVGYVFRYQDVNNFYFLNISLVSGVAQYDFFRVVGGTKNDISTPVNGLSATAGSPFHVKIVINGQLATVYQNGSSTPLSSFAPFNFGVNITAAGLIGAVNGNGGTGTRNIANYTVLQTGADLSAYRTSYSLASSDNVTEYAADFPATTTAGKGLGYDFRIQSSGDSYRLLLTPGAGLQLLKSTGGSAGVPGTYTTLQSSQGTQILAAFTSGRVKLVCTGSAISAYLDGEQQINYTDTASPYLSGTSVAFAGIVAESRVRAWSVRASDTLTVSGLASGQTVTLRGAGGIPISSQVVASGNATFSNIHWPLSFVQSGTNDFYPSDNGLIWGGDSLSVAFPVSGTKRRIQ